MDNVDLTLGHLRAFKCIREGEVVNTSLGTLADLPVQRLVWTELRPPAGHEVGLFMHAPFTAPEPTAATRLTGAYRRKRGLEMRYTYSGYCRPSAEGTYWVVTVRCNRKLRGTPSGVFDGGMSDEPALRAHVERSIEALSQMEE